MALPPVFPTPLHQRAAEEIVAFFDPAPEVAAVLLVNSLARGVGTTESDVDIAVLVQPGTSPARLAELNLRWQEHYAQAPSFRQLREAGRFTYVHLDLFDGRFEAEPWDDGGGPDGFELEIGNRIAYGVPLSERGDALAQLRAAWLPFYSEELRAWRLAMVATACRYDLDHVPFFVGRGLYFQAFDRLYKALQEFLQALFIVRRVYPIAYNKWIREQVVERLGLPELYAQLPTLLELSRLESDETARKAELLRGLLDRWVGPERAWREQ
jgi:predicted nucleotidyltransferase